MLCFSLHLLSGWVILMHPLQATHRSCHHGVCRTILNGSRKIHPDHPQETLPAGFLSTLCTVIIQRQLVGTCRYIIRNNQSGRKSNSLSPCPCFRLHYILGFVVLWFEKQFNTFLLWSFRNKIIMLNKRTINSDSSSPVQTVQLEGRSIYVSAH